LFDLPAACHPIRRRNAYKKGQIFWPNLAHRLRYRQPQPHPIFERATVTILTTVAQWREELMDQITMRSMDFDNLEAGFQGALGGQRKGRHNRLDTC